MRRLVEIKHNEWNPWDLVSRIVILMEDTWVNLAETFSAGVKMVPPGVMKADSLGRPGNLVQRDECDRPFT